MPYEKNKTAYQDEEWFEREQRNVLDVRNWNRDLMGQTFYQICHNNKNKYSTIDSIKNREVRETYFSLGVDSTHCYGRSFFVLFWVTLLNIQWGFPAKMPSRAFTSIQEELTQM